jgi:hypothetical protein
MRQGFSFRICLALVALATLPALTFAETFRVATYNVENYLVQPTESRSQVKSADAKAKIRESIKAMNPDVIALQEMGGTNALLELRASLQADGQDFPFWEHIQSFDTNIHVAVLSKLPILARRPHTNDFFLLDGRQFQVKRGFAEVDIQAATNFTSSPRTSNHVSPYRTPMNPRSALMRPRSCAASLTRVSPATRRPGSSSWAILTTPKIPLP